MVIVALLCLSSVLLGWLLPVIIAECRASRALTASWRALDAWEQQLRQRNRAAQARLEEKIARE
jgi:hypothetical protein